jgi:hypothetical protein
VLNRGLERKRSGVEVLELQKDYSFNNTMVFKSIKFVAFKHFMIF